MEGQKQMALLGLYNRIKPSLNRKDAKRNIKLIKKYNSLWLKQYIRWQYINRLFFKIISHVTPYLIKMPNL